MSFWPSLYFSTINLVVYHSHIGLQIYYIKVYKANVPWRKMASLLITSLAGCTEKIHLWCRGCNSFKVAHILHIVLIKFNVSEINL